MLPGVFIRDHVRLAHQMPVNQFAPGHFEIDAFQAVEEGSMSKPRQRCGALERQVLSACSSDRRWSSEHPEVFARSTPSLLARPAAELLRSV